MRYNHSTCINQNSTELKFCCWNIGGIHDKLEDDLFLSEIKQYDVVLLVETHIGYDKIVSVDGFHYFPVCRAKSANGRYYGGLAVLTRTNIRPYVSFLKNTSTEYQWLKLDKKFFSFQKDLYLCLAYIPPNQSSYAANMQHDLIDLIENDILMYKTKGDIMICGDLNARSGSQQDFISNDEVDHVPVYDDYNIDVSSVPRQSKDSTIDARGKSLIEICIGNQLRILNGRCFGDMFGQYTCYTPNGCSVVDYTIVSESILDQILYFHVSDFLATLSDCHCKLSWGMLANFNCSNNGCSLNPLPVKYYWDNESAADFQQALKTDGISNKIKCYMNTSITDTQDAACQIKDIITEAASISLKSIDISKKKLSKSSVNKKQKKRKKWFDSDLTKMRKRVISNGKLYSMYHNDPIVRGRYFKLYRIYNKTKKYKERQYKKQLLEQIENLHSENPKEYWNLIDILKEEKYKTSPAENIKPESWVSHFQSLGEIPKKFEDRVSQLHNLVHTLESQPVFNYLDSVITIDEINNAVKKLKNNKATGLDTVSNEMLKAAQSYLGPCLLKLFNACLSSGQYPSQWSDGYIIPLHKSNDTSDPSNYRGISIMSAIGKLFSIVLNNRLDNFLVDNNVINNCQIGFSKHARTADHMFILKTLFDKYCCKPGGRLYACFVDFRKAFDSVIHEGLRFKLLQLGVGTKFYNIITNMYKNSQACIRLGNGLTNPFKVGVGVRQGDVLSPNLFKIFINDLPEYFQSCIDPVKLKTAHLHCLMYADDVV
ncbi:MAG: reverse transcriptase family protein [Candidatus Thiodiazotropha sp.]